MFVLNLDVEEVDMFNPCVQVCDFVKVKVYVVGIIGDLKCR